MVHTEGFTIEGIPAPGALQVAVKRSLDVVIAWFEAAEFSLDPRDILKIVEVFSERDVFVQRLENIFGSMPDEFRANPHLSGTVSETRLLIVSADLYRRSFEILYPQFPWSPEEYEKLMIHELAHRAHEVVAIRESGSSDGMGPIWFFEGLAVVIAGQFPSASSLSDEEFRVAIARKSPGYPLYGQCVRFLLERYDHRHILLQAMQPGFPENCER